MKTPEQIATAVSYGSATQIALAIAARDAEWLALVTASRGTAPASSGGDEAAVREMAAYWALATKPARVPGYRMKDDAVDKMIDLGMSGCANAAFAAGRKAAFKRCEELLREADACTKDRSEADVMLRKLIDAIAAEGKRGT